MSPLPPPPSTQKRQTSPTPDPSTRKSEEPPLIFRQPRPTSSVVWFFAIFCLLLCLFLIFLGVATLVVSLNVKPRNPSFDIPNALLGSVYLDSAEYFNGDYTFLVNISNPNHKITLKYEYVDIQLYFSNALIATQAIQPFTQKPGESKLETVHLISSLVYLPRNIAGELQRQVQGYRVKYILQGKFRLRASLGLAHFAYWLHGRCELEMTGPPSGILITRSCRTKR